VIGLGLRGPGGYTLRCFTSLPRAGGKFRVFGFYTIKQKNKKERKKKEHEVGNGLGLFLGSNVISRVLTIRLN